MGIRVLVLGASGYLGSKLVPALLDMGLEVRAACSDKQALEATAWTGVDRVHADARVPSTLPSALHGVEVVYYLAHPMYSPNAINRMEVAAANNLSQAAQNAGVDRIIYLGGVIAPASADARVRPRVTAGDVLRAGTVPVVELRAGIIVGSGAAALEVMRELVSHLPIIVAPRWLRTLSSPIALDNVLHYLLQLALVELPEQSVFEIAGPELLTFEAMMRTYAATSGKRIRIMPVPLMLPRLSRWCLGLFTPVSASAASSLIAALEYHQVTSDHTIRALFPQHLLEFEESLDGLAQIERGNDMRPRKAEPLRRAPLPAELIARSTVLGLSNLRQWADGKPDAIETYVRYSEAELSQRYSGIIGKRHHYLALSGGGENGAFAAGLLAGWTASGTRPEFTIATGISTGALIAPFAFLGPEYDHAIREVYTGYAMEDLVDRRTARLIIRNDALTDSTPLQGVIARYMVPEVVSKIAAAHAQGRFLMIGTTHLDAGRPMMWDIGAIAASGRPGALSLIRKIMLASASIPVGLPPVVIQVEADGKSFDEMHVDGGVTGQVFLYPVQLDWNVIISRLGLPAEPRVYVVRNGYLEPVWQNMEQKIVPIAKRTISSLIRTQGIGDLFRMYATIKRDGLDFNLAYIPENFAANEQRQGIEYMKSLYQHAFTAAQSGYPWEKAPPGFEE